MKKDLFKVIALSCVVGLWGIISWVCLYFSYKYKIDSHFVAFFISAIFNVPAVCYCVGCVEDYIGGKND